MSAQHVRVVITSDRFYDTDLSMEHEIATRFPALTVDVATALAPDDDTMIAVARDADAIVTASTDRVSRRTIEALPHLRVIGRYAVGFDNIDVAAATERGILITHVPGYCTDEVADHAVALLLALNRRLFSSDRRLRAGEWVGHNLDTAFVAGGEIRALRDLTVGIVGFGRIGQAVARRLAPFGCRLLATDPAFDVNAARAVGAIGVTLPELLANSDLVTLHCPLTPGTHHLIGAGELAAMRAGAMLVNTARGPIVDNAALLDALRHGTIAGAALDVMEQEPLPPDAPLLALDNLIVTPHSAYYSEAAMRTLRRETFAEVLTALNGGQPRSIINPDVLARRR